MITELYHAETILRTGQADMVFLGREMPRDQYWPGRAAKALGVKTDGLLLMQYEWAGWRPTVGVPNPIDRLRA